MGFYRVLEQFLIMKKILIVLLLFSIELNSQTTLYFDRLAVPVYTPTVHANWNVTTGFTYGNLLFGKAYLINTATLTSGLTGAAATRELLIASYITPVLGTQTIATGTVISAQIKTNMSSTTSRTGSGEFYVRVMNEDGTIASEVGNATTTALTTTSTNRTYSITLGGNLSITGGQRIIFEFGWKYLTGSDVSTTASIVTLFNANTTDLPADNTATAAQNNWVKFSNSIVLASGYGKGIML